MGKFNEEMSAIWRSGIQNDDVASNPFEGVAERRSFTDAEVAAILTAARKQRGVRRWLPWVAITTGARLAEIAHSSKSDVVEISGAWALHIHDEAEDGEVRSVKNVDSVRTIPLHPALVAEGFLDYVRALPAGSPLFPDVKPDGVFGQRGVIAGKRVG